MMWGHINGCLAVHIALFLVSQTEYYINRLHWKGTEVLSLSDSVMGRHSWTMWLYCTVEEVLLREWGYQRDQLDKQ